MKTWQGMKIEENKSSTGKDNKFKLRYENSHYGKYDGIGIMKESLEYDNAIKNIKLIYKREHNLKDIANTIYNILREAIIPEGNDDFDRIMTLLIKSIKTGAL